MKIENAYLCEDCQAIAESDGHGRCGICGSPALLSVAKVLNRNLHEEVLDLAPRASAKADEEAVIFHIRSDGRTWHAA
jgi:hypothetical protein